MSIEGIGEGEVCSWIGLHPPILEPHLPTIEEYIEMRIEEAEHETQAPSESSDNSDNDAETNGWIKA